MNIPSKIYKTLRFLLMTIIIAIVAGYALLYIALSIPSVQDRIRQRGEKELSTLLNANVSIDKISFSPFNKLVLYDVAIPDQGGNPMLGIDKLGAGISLYNLITHKRLVFTYGEIIGLKGNITKATPDSPTNVQFIIDALSPKDKKNPPKQFDITIHNVVIRKSALTFDVLSEPKKASGFDKNHMAINNLRADISLPQLKNDDFIIDLKRLSFDEKSGLEIKNFTTDATINNDAITLLNTEVNLPNSNLVIPSAYLDIDSLKSLGKQLPHAPFNIDLQADITPSDLACFLPKLSSFTESIKIETKVNGTIKQINVAQLIANSKHQGFNIQTAAQITMPTEEAPLMFDVPRIELQAQAPEIAHITGNIASLSPSVHKIISNCGNVSINGAAHGSANDFTYSGIIATSLGELNIDGDLKSNKAKKDYAFAGKISTEKFDIGQLLSKRPLLGEVALSVDLDANVQNGKTVSGTLDGSIPFFEFKGYRYNNIVANLETENSKKIVGSVNIDDPNARLDLIGEVLIDGVNSQVDVTTNVEKINLANLNLYKKYPDHSISLYGEAFFIGNSFDNSTGNISLSNIEFIDSKKNGITIPSLAVEANNSSYPQQINISSDFLNGSVVGSFNFNTLVPEIKNMIAQALPSLVKPTEIKGSSKTNNFDFNFTLTPTEELQSFLKLPIKVLDKATLTGNVSQDNNYMYAELLAPYILNGNKLIEGSQLNASFNTQGNHNILVNAQTVIPVKKGKVLAQLSANSVNDRVDTDLSWRVNSDHNYSGNLNLSSLILRNPDNSLSADIDINPTNIVFNDTVWNVHPAKVNVWKDVITVNNMMMSNEKQFINIDGEVSKNPDTDLCVELQDISLDYIFEMLNISNVTFGGRATGTFLASNLMSKIPHLSTPGLHVKGLAYNNAVMGDADIKSNWDNESKGINIEADLHQYNNRESKITGAIFPTLDSLYIDFQANKANVAFLKPFMEAFTSDIQGYASGHAVLYGNFKRIDLLGDIYGEDLKMKVDYTDVYYTASDSVKMRPGYIGFKDITIFDRYGQKAKVDGWVTHNHFHDAEFNFSIHDAKNFLCYDVKPNSGTNWYGTIFGNGSATIIGEPGKVDIGVHMETAPNSKFTLVLSDEEVAAEYNFITFTDSSKKQEEEIKAQQTVSLIPESVRKATEKVIKSNESRPSVFSIDLNADVTPDAELVLIMDPAGGDRVKAYGSGPVRMTYNSADEEIAMAGTYTLDKGDYIFTLQDIIVKNFDISSGSKVKFNGDPFTNTSIDIKAYYKTNGNLLDLDESFATERELNRTNVPVYAVLNAKGNMVQPDISFDIELPTLTSEAYRKVKSVISTDDMMNRQIIYLLALGRFYTPDYMKANTHNNELASVASSTLSSQLGNVLGQISDSWSIAPNFRSEKGDFSDMEVDVALRSQLLNNRLLFNGNFGYRENSLNTTNTNFIGDFDIEYLLNARGTMRLKAYNHFNDQNYYVKNALTTQGVGIEFKHDFNKPFSFLKKWFHRSPKRDDGNNNDINYNDSINAVVPNDSLKVVQDSTKIVK